MNIWLYKDKTIQDISDFPENTYGFIYIITHLPSGKKYLGKKNLFFERNKKLGKKELLQLKEERKGQKGRLPSKKKVITESDWKTYYGSSSEIKELINTSTPEDFRREIIRLVSSKKLLTYYETKYLFKYNVLLNDNFLNSNILGKFFKSDFE